MKSRTSAANPPVPYEDIGYNSAQTSTDYGDNPSSTDRGGNQSSDSCLGVHSAVRSNKFEPAFRLLSIAVVVLGFLPMARMVYWLYAVGGNCIGNDYVHWIKVIDGVLSGTFNWMDYPRAVFLGSHFCFFSILIELAMCSLGIWDVRLESLIGMAMLFGSTVLLWDAATTRSDGKWRWVVLACLAAINFGTTQSAILLSSMFSLRLTGLCQLGYTLALWALVRFKDKAERHGAALTLVAMGGILASYSCGAALPVWGSLFVALILLGYRRIRELAIFFFSMIVGLFPYLYFFIADHKKDPNLAAGLGKVGMDPSQIIDLIGRPLCNGIGQNFNSIAIGHVAGLLGLAFLAGMLLAERRKLLPSAKFAVIVSLVVFSAIASCLLIEVRAQIAPWYATMMKYYWLGFATLAILVLRAAFDSQTKKSQRERLLVGGISGAAMLCFLVLYAMTNVSFEDKQFYLLTRTPASESCQRHYQTAPTYGEDLLFQWGAGNQYFCRLLGSVLHKHGLLSFNRTQEWTLQGEYFLDSVSFNRNPNCPTPHWIGGNRADRIKSWRDYDHLNLSVQAPQTVRWQVSLPQAATDARFETSCALAVRKYHQSNRADTLPIAARISVVPELHAESGVSFTKPISVKEGWSKIEIPLNQFVGEPVVISFSCLQPQTKTTNGFADAAVFEYPRISFKQDHPQTDETETANIKPENTDLSPSFHQPVVTDLSLATSPGLNVVATPRNDLNLNQFSHLYFRAIAGGAIAPVVRAKLNLNDSRTMVITVPLLLDNLKHAYTYDFKLLELPANTILHSIDFTTCGANQAEQNNTAISDVHLLRVH